MFVLIPENTARKWQERGSEAPHRVGSQANSEGLQRGGVWEDAPACPSASPLPTPAPDIRLDWETYALEEKEDQLLELLVFYGPPFPLRDQDGNEVLCPETQGSSSSSPSPSVSNKSSSSNPEVAHSVSTVLGGAGSKGGRVSGPGACVSLSNIPTTGREQRQRQ